MTPLPKPACPMSGTRQPSDLFTTDQMRAYGAAEYSRAMSEVNVSRFADWMDEAAEDIEFWGAYASAYFIAKHKLSDTLEDYRNRATLLRKLGASS